MTTGPAAPAPTVSVVISCFDRERYVAEAITSVVDQELPAGDVLEVIVVDDGSTDRSVEIARSFGPPVVVVEQENRGAAGASNTGIRTARGEFVAFCDSDDLWLPGKLVAQLDAARQGGHDLVFGLLEEFLSPELDPEVVRTRPLRPPLPGTVPSCALVRRSLFDDDRLGLFDETLANGAWVNWYTRVRAADLPEVTLDRVVSRRRIHEHNNWSTQGQQGAGYLRALRSWVHEQRAREQSGS
ncbi:MAG: glycosyltransferase family 2 protein [Acidimicrobiia bacterium]